MTDIERVEELRDIFEKVSLTNSAKEKTLIIHQNKENDLLFEVLKFTCDEQIVAGINKAKIEKNVEVYTENSVYNLLQMLNYIMTNTTGTDITIGKLQGYMSKFKNPETKKFVAELFCKRIKNGLSKKIVNAVYGKNTISEFVFMKGDSYEKHLAKVKGLFYLTKKFDGNRLFVKTRLIDGDYSVLYYSKAGSLLNGFEYLDSDFKTMSSTLDSFSPENENNGWVFDGECLAYDDGAMTTNELYRKTQKIFKSKEVKYGMNHNVYDIVPLDEFEKGKSKDGYSKRREMIDLLFESVNVENVIPVEVLYKGKDKAQIDVWSDWAEEKGLEGIMLNMDKPYECKRVSHLLKVKKFFYSDVVVLDVYEGDKKNTGKMGGAIVQFTDFEVSIGSGWSDAQRVEFWEHPERLIGSIVELRYFEVTENSKGGKGLRFPTLSRLRPDKTIKDVSYE